MAVIKKTKRSEIVTELTYKPLVYFSDFPTAFTATPQSDLQVVTNEESVIQAIKNIVFTNGEERLYNPLFGCNLRALLFEPANLQTESMVVDRIRTSIENFEPRANLIDVIVDTSPDENAYFITIVFSIINKQDPITLDLVLSRIR